jgi:hypothetical protein
MLGVFSHLLQRLLPMEDKSFSPVGNMVISIFLLALFLCLEMIRRKFFALVPEQLESVTKCKAIQIKVFSILQIVVLHLSLKTLFRIELNFNCINSYRMFRMCIVIVYGMVSIDGWKLFVMLQTLIALSETYATYT